MEIWITSQAGEGEIDSVKADVDLHHSPNAQRLETP